MSEIFTAVIAEIEARGERGGGVSGASTGFRDLDNMTDGLKKGELIVLAGRPSMGKTAFALNIAEQVAMNGVPTLIFSMEMGDTQLVTRSLASIGEIDGKRLASGRLDDDEWGRVVDAGTKLYSMPMVVDESPNLSVAQMRARARRQKHRGGLGLVVIDYLQLMSGKGSNRNEELGDITRSLKLMARDLDVPVIALSQLSRKVEERSDKRPLLSDLRESGSIEQDADIVLMIYRDEYYNDESRLKGFAEVLVRKNRMGEVGGIHLVFQPQYSRFRDADQSAVAALCAPERDVQPRRAHRGGLQP